MLLKASEIIVGKALFEVSLIGITGISDIFHFVILKCYLSLTSYMNINEEETLQLSCKIYMIIPIAKNGARKNHVNFRKTSTVIQYDSGSKPYQWLKLENVFKVHGILWKPNFEQQWEQWHK